MWRGAIYASSVSSIWAIFMTILTVAGGFESNFDLRAVGSYAFVVLPLLTFLIQLPDAPWLSIGSPDASMYTRSARRSAGVSW